MENRVYVEKNDNFWRDLLVRIALILLFVFLLIWLFPMPKLETFYDRIFADNIKIMQEAAKDYYHVERLPKEIGEKSRITLREMIDQKLVLPFLDRDGNTCDFDKSYVEVIRMETEYIFKINLSCPTKTDYVINHFGCYDVCEDDTCKEEELSKLKEYQYYRDFTKSVIDGYKCPKGYNLKGSSCIKSSSILEKIKANIKCSSGYTYNNLTDRCEKKVIKTINADLICPIGYAYNENSKMCLRYDTKTENPEPVCTEGIYDSNTKKCVILENSSYNALPNCINGVFEAGRCKVVENNPYEAKKEYSTRTLTKPATEVKDWACQVEAYRTLVKKPNTEYFTSEYLRPEPRYVCNENIPECIVTFYLYRECNAVIMGSCSDKTYKYNRTTRSCTKQESYISSYSCPLGGTLSGTTCNRVTISYLLPSYECPQGGTLTGTKCNISSTSSVSPIQTCTKGSLINGECKFVRIERETPVYTCDGTLNKDKCIITSTLTKPINSVCKAGYVRMGDMCIKTISSSQIIKGTPIYKKISSREYKWSRETSLKGWIRTGKIREVEVDTKSLVKESFEK